MTVRDTSLRAYDDLQASLPRRERLVWNALAKCEHAPTAYELTEIMKARDQAFDVNSCRPRLTRLYDKGCVRRLGKRTCRVTGKLAYVWQVVLSQPPAKPTKKAATITLSPREASLF